MSLEQALQATTDAINRLIDTLSSNDNVPAFVKNKQNAAPNPLPAATFTTPADMDEAATPAETAEGKRKRRTKAQIEADELAAKQQEIPHFKDQSAAPAAPAAKTVAPPQDAQIGSLQSDDPLFIATTTLANKSTDNDPDAGVNEIKKILAPLGVGTVREAKRSSYDGLLGQMNAALKRLDAPAVSFV